MGINVREFTTTDVQVSLDRDQDPVRLYQLTLVRLRLYHTEYGRYFEADLSSHLRCRHFTLYRFTVFLLQDDPSQPD